MIQFLHGSFHDTGIGFMMIITTLKYSEYGLHLTHITALLVLNTGQFTSHKCYTACENSCIMPCLALEFVKFNKIILAFTQRFLLLTGNIELQRCLRFPGGKICYILRNEGSDPHH